MNVFRPFRDTSRILSSDHQYLHSSLGRRLYHRIQDCWNRPICSNPGAHIKVMERRSEDNNFSLHTTERTSRCLNLGSYNYLGFADDWGNTCKSSVMEALRKYPVSCCSSRSDFGNLEIHEEVEKTIASFIGKEVPSNCRNATHFPWNAPP